jgi:hypothetical protein
MRISYITLLCKNPEQSYLLTNWRPISLLNIDYKIVSRFLIGRIRKVIDSVVNVNQTSAVPGRSMINNMATIRDVMSYYKETHRELYILTVDQAKVYSKVCVNRFFTRRFDVKRSVRQGCSLSPALYVLCIEILACKLKVMLFIKVFGCQMEIRMIAHADDTALFAESVSSLSRFLQEYNRFAAVSGAAINKGKCVILKQGRRSLNEFEGLGVQQVESVKICGVWFVVAAQEKNEKRILDGMRDNESMKMGT